MTVTVNSSGLNFNNNGGDGSTNTTLEVDTASNLILSFACLIIKNSLDISDSNANQYLRGALSSGNPYGWLNKSGVVGSGTLGGNQAYSLVTWYRIMCAGEIDCYSDKRIKKNICEIPKDFALNTIRNLIPCTYNYKDVVKKGANLNYGFIAQEVDEILPSVVKKTKDFIPNIYEVANISKNIITLTNFSTKDLLTQETNVKIKMFDNKDQEVIVTLKEIIDDKTFTIQENILEVSDNKIFVFGQEVDDMHSLEKNAIFSVTTAAVKYLDIELQETKSIVEKQQKVIDIQTQQIKDLITTTEQLKKDLEILQSKS